MRTTAKSFVLRFLFLYFFIQCIPLDPKYYEELFALPWGNFRYQDFFLAAHYTPRFFGSQPVFADWLVIALLAVIGDGIWSVTDRRRHPGNHQAQNNDRLYYWIRTIVRYRLAIALLAYGFIKLFPLQSPHPSLSNLNTHYGDFTRWKLFSLSLGIVPSYEIFLGGVEIAAALLLLFRRTASVGALIVLLFTGNVLMSNIAYDGGEVVYCAYLLALAGFVLAFDLQRLFQLLVLRQPAAPNTFRLQLAKPWERYGRIGLKSLVFFFFVVLLGFRASWGYHHDPYQLPNTKGLTAAAGIYNVSLFKLGKDTLPYSNTDSIRWNNVVFEHWATLSIAGHRPAAIDPANTENVTATDDLDKTYESEGTNGRRYYSYGLDSTRHTLILRNKNAADSTDQWVLQYARPDSAHIILSGLSPQHDSVYVVLHRINKKYLLEEAAKAGRTKSVKL